MGLGLVVGVRFRVRGLGVGLGSAHAAWLGPTSSLTAPSLTAPSLTAPSLIACSSAWLNGATSKRLELGRGIGLELQLG